MAASRRGRGDGARNRAQWPPHRCCVICSVERARAPSRFDDHGGLTRRGNQAISLQEPPLGGGKATWCLSKNDTGFDDATEERVMTAGIKPVDSSGEKCHCRSFAGECRSMRHSIDAVGSPGDNADVAIDEARGELHRDMLTVPGGCSCADDGDGTVKSIEGVTLPSAPQDNRLMRADVTKTLWPVRHLWNEEKGACGSRTV